MTSKTIYPYVYRLDHPTTNEFYIGFRSANKVPSEQDLGFKYFTSAPKVKSIFNEFKINIIAEFFNPDDAYDHEQYLIYCNLGNPLMLNRMCHYKSKYRYTTAGTPHSEETKTKMKDAAKNRAPVTDETRERLSIALKGKKHRTRTDEHKKNLSIVAQNRSEEEKQRWATIRTGISHSDETKAKISMTNKGHIVTDETKAKISMTNKGHIVTNQTKEKISAMMKIKFLSIIATKKSYSKAIISRNFPEFKQFY